MGQKTSSIGATRMAVGMTMLALANAAQTGEPSPADRQRGEELSTSGAGSVASCASCHGKNGEGNAAPSYPMLAGLQAPYLYEQLQAFAAGTRRNVTMETMVHAMEEQQMRDAAAYYASLQPVTADAVKAERDLLEQGRVLFRYGKAMGWDQWLPACYLCHGEQGQGAGDRFPALAGQHAGYVEKQLQALQQGSRSNDPNGLMTAIAARLKEDDIHAVAAFLSKFHQYPEPTAAFLPSEGVDP